ncbi:MAG: hypothetical protein IJR99_14535 [Kiritimatiellae bacterium]|nr:hypothetical protein [Kiritimatiellia bacterium]
MISFLLLCTPSISNSEPVDQSKRAAGVADSREEPILRWWGRPTRKVFTPPAGLSPKMFVRVTFAPEHPVPGTIAFSTEAIGSYFPGEYTWLIDTDSVSPAKVYWGNRTVPRKPIAPASSTPWLEITQALHYGYVEVMMVEARDTSGRHRLPEGDTPAFRLDFSHDGSTVIGSVSNGGGRIACGMVSLAKGTIENDVQLSEADLRRARAAGRTPARRPRRFPIGLWNAVSPSTMSPQAFTNELEVFRLLGVNDTGFETTEILDPEHRYEPTHLFRNPKGDFLACGPRGQLGCLCSPNHVNITNALLQLRKGCAGPLSRGRKLIVNIMDEPHYDLPMLTNCHSKVKSCRERFGRDFVFSPEAPEGMLATIVYRDQMVADYYKAVSDAARAIDTNLLVTANFGISLVFGGNLSAPGTSVFRLADAKAIGIGQTEDWCNLQITRQFSSYMCDVYRAATERNGMDFVMCSILLSPPEVVAKAYSEVGHGAKGLSFFNYGPHWFRGDNKNRCDEIYPAIRGFCEATAEAEDWIVDAKVAKGDAALLFSESGDRLEIIPGEKRNWIERNPYGKDRMSISLMLNHCGVRTDILDETGIEKRLADYRVLFATDRCVRRETAHTIANWIKHGGILVKTANALTGDELGKPLPEGMFGKSEQIWEIDFSPWRDYVKPAKQVGECYSHRNFPQAPLEKTREIIERSSIRRRIFTDCPLVESSLLEKAEGCLVALANWSETEHRTVKVTLTGVPSVKHIRSASGAKVTWKQETGQLVAEVEIGWGDYLIIQFEK